jgi:GTP-binding protein
MLENQHYCLFWHQLNQNCWLPVYNFKTKPRNCSYRDFQSFVIADIPGIIEGAAEGIRTLFLETYRKKFNLIVSCPCRYPDIKGEYDILVNELTKYNPEMLDKERLLVISKCDMLDDELTAELKEN